MAGMKQLIGGKRLRPNRLFSNFKGMEILAKVPQELGADEYNVVFGLGRQAVGIGATVNYTANCPRDMILRRLIIGEELATAGGNSDFTVTAITIEGNAALLGAAVPGTAFQATSVHPPCFDLPAAGGTPVTVTVTNNNAAVRPASIAFTID